MFSISRLDGVTNLVTLKAGSSYLENLKSSMPKTRAKNMMSRKFNFGLDVVKERKEYKNLGVTKNYAHSCSGNIDEAIKKTRHKGGMILSMGFDRKKVNPPQFILNYGSKFASFPLCLAPNFGLSPTLILLVLSAVRIGLLEKCFICFYSRFPVLYQLKMKLRNESDLSLLIWH